MQRGPTIPDLVLAEALALALVLAEVFFAFTFTRPAIFNTFTYISLILTTISLKIPLLSLKIKKISSVTRKNCWHWKVVTFDSERCTYYTDILVNLSSRQLRVASLAALAQQLKDTSSAMLVVDISKCRGPSHGVYIYVCGVIPGLIDLE